MSPESVFESGFSDNSETVEINKEMESQENIKKPEILYHASSRRDLKEIEARAEGVRDPNEGPVVFGTPDEAYASCFLVSDTKGSWINIGQWSSDPVKHGPWHFICSDRNRFEENDHGGTIYSMNPEGFTTDPAKGTGTAEWVSRDDVKPVNRKDYDSALEAMIDNGVQVFFTDPETMKKIRESEDRGYSITKNLVSENEKLNRNYIPL